MRWLKRRVEPVELLRELALPLLFLAMVVTVHLIWWVFDLPRNDDLLRLVEGWFDRYGYIALVASAIIEGALVLGFYFPGAFVIFLSVILSGSVTEVATVVALVSVAFTLGLSIDYVLGRYGWHQLLLRLGFRKQMQDAEKRLSERGYLAILLTYWDVNLASFTATAAGVLRYPYVKFLVYSVVTVTAWNAFWGTVVYTVGKPAMVAVTGNGKYALSIILIWMVALTLRHVWRRHLALRR